MKKSAIKFFFTLTFISTSFYAQLPKSLVQRYSIKSINKVYPAGKTYKSDIVLKKINSMIGEIEKDESIFYLERQKYSILKDLSKTIPENFLFADLNNDKIEDLIFQSTGSIINDGLQFSIFISDSIYKKHNLLWFNGIVTEISDYSLIPFPRDNKKFKGLMVNYIKYGCCSYSGWDSYKTDFIFLTLPALDMKKIISIRTININSTDY